MFVPQGDGRGQPLVAQPEGVDQLHRVRTQTPAQFVDGRDDPLERAVLVAVFSAALLSAFAVCDFVGRKSFEKVSGAEDAELYLVMAPGCAACKALDRLVRDYDLSAAGVQVLDYASERDREVIQALSPDIGTPAIIAVRGGDTVGEPEITTGAGACYAQIKKMADAAHT